MKMSEIRVVVDTADDLLKVLEKYAPCKHYWIDERSSDMFGYARQRCRDCNQVNVVTWPRS